jgi:antitoxin (DNA-binding transcriptional repressor) of toxin-antitoxin stability system
MNQMSITNVKKTFVDIVDWIETGKENEIIVTKYNKPIAKIVPFNSNAEFNKRFGIAKEKFSISDDFDAPDDEIARMFGMID